MNQVVCKFYNSGPKCPDSRGPGKQQTNVFAYHHRNETVVEREI